MGSDYILKKQLKEIGKLVETRFVNEEHIGVLSGISGMALFQFYYAKYLDDDRLSDLGVEMISHCIQKINEGYSYPTYCTGIAGFGWTVQHLNDEGFIELDCDDLLGEFDTYLRTQMEFDISNNNFDFLHGATGYGFYFLKRYYGSKNKELKYRYVDYLKELILALEKSAVKKDNYFKWESVLDIRRGNKGFNFSLSHGMSSILNFLSRAHEIDELREITVAPIKGCLNYLLGFKNKYPENESLFPSWIEPELPIEYNARLAWCYGDLGVGLSVVKAGITLNDNLRLKQGIEILDFTTNKKLLEETNVIDAGICHGSYGNAQIYHRLFQQYENGIFKKSADFWIQDGIEKATHKDGYVGYKQWNGLTKEWTPELSLLEGVAGIGLVIIDYLSKKPNPWDECLMIS